MVGYREVIMEIWVPITKACRILVSTNVLAVMVTLTYTTV
jgi:hypothetical protein